MHICRCLPVWFGLAWTVTSYAAEPVPPFVLKEIHGEEYTAAKWKGKKAVVLFFLATECPVSNFYTTEYVRLVDAYGTKGVAFCGVHSDPDLNAEQAARHAREYRLAFPIVMDPKQVLATATGARVTPEAVVLSEHGAVSYRGRIDDRFAENGRRRDEAQQHDLRAALDAVLKGKAPTVPETKAFGCPLPRRE